MAEIEEINSDEEVPQQEENGTAEEAQQRTKQNRSEK